MRLARVVAAGVVIGALAAFIGALLRPRSIHAYDPAAPIATGVASQETPAPTGPGHDPGDGAGTRPDESAEGTP
jgi:hypothetical protein